MKKSILAAFGAFTGSSVAVLAISYHRDGEFDFVYAFTLGIAMAAVMYIVAQWKQQKEQSSSEPDD